MKHFTYNEISAWRAVPLRSTVLAANACHKGSDYTGCSKSDIYDSFDKLRYNGSSYPDVKVFSDIMNALTSMHCRVAEKLHQDVSQLIRDYTTER